MSINVSEIACSPASVVAVLADGWLFSGWVMGVSFEFLL